jgi:hypothetical protein
MSVEKLTNGAKALVFMAVMVGFGLILLGNFQSTSGITTAANTAIGKFVTGIGGFADWVGIIVLALVFFYIMGLLSKSGKSE